MKKAIRQFLSAVLAVAGLVLFGVLLVFMIPVDYIKYKRSLYYKKYRKKYTLFGATGVALRLYNEILKHGLPIRFYENPNNPALACGWFVLGDTLIILDAYHFEYDGETGVWKTFCQEDDESREMMSLDEYIECEIQDANSLTGQTICKDAVVLIDEYSIDDVEKAKTEPRFLVYDNDPEEIVKQLCETRREE